MNKNRMFIRQWAAKLKMIKTKGGICKKCGIDLTRSPWKADFHHRNSEEKEYNIALLMKGSLEPLEREVSKCDLLCANCHRDKHALKDKYDLLFDEISEYVPISSDKWTNKETEKLIKLHGKGLSNNKISKMMDRHETTITFQLKKLNLISNFSHDNKHKSINIKDILKLKNQGLSNTKTAKALGCCRQLIDRMLST